MGGSVAQVMNLEILVLSVDVSFNRSCLARVGMLILSAALCGTPRGVMPKLSGATEFDTWRKTGPHRWGTGLLYPQMDSEVSASKNFN